MLMIAISCSYIYQAPPFRWSYLGLGEPLCFIALGPLWVCAFYLTQIPNHIAAVPSKASISQSIAMLPSSAIALSIIVGTSTTAILFCSHFHQIEGDRAHGKMSPLVRLGTRKAAKTLKVAVIALYTFTLACGVFNVLPLSVWLASMAVYRWATDMVALAEMNPDSPEVLKFLKFLAIKWHIRFNMALCLGLLASKFIGI